MSVKNAMTADFLHSAYAGESMAHMRYMIWGDMAGKEGFPNIEKLFHAIAYAERVHATNHFNVIDGDTVDAAVTAGAVFGVKKTIENLQGAINGELHEVEQMYPVFLNTARLQQESGAERSFNFALEAEKLHAALFQKAQDAVKENKDIACQAVYICPVCGHTILDEAPEHCPVCGASKSVYVKF